MIPPREETRRVKTALSQAGYEATVGHGTGTSASWIEVTVRGPWSKEEFHEEHHDLVYSLTKIAAGRADRHDDPDNDIYREKITIYYQPAGARKTKACRCR